ncbi:MAG: YheC/YheD family protein [Bacillota bacterium]|nr:YheC/YheD family protein [Bacillota bacterium]
MASPLFNINRSQDKNSDFIIHPRDAELLKIRNKKRAFVSFGSERRFVNVKISMDFGENNITLSDNIIEDLHLPDFVEYEISVFKNEIRIGPYIGLLVSNTNEKFAKGKFSRLMVYTKAYSKCNGAVVAFSLDKVDKVKRMIVGYCYNPVSGSWEEGVFPYPWAIFRTIGMNEEWKNHFLTVIGDNVFNSVYFNKWEMYQWMSESKFVNKLLPDTILYKSGDDIDSMLCKHEKIYVKPISGLKGNGVVKIEKDQDIITFKYRENGKNQIIRVCDRDDGVNFINRMFVPKKYIIQEAIKLIKYDGGLIDFRCVMEKDNDLTWKCFAVFGRCGVKDSVVSNVSNGGSVFLQDDLLKKAFSSSQYELAEIKEKFAKTTLRICQELDKAGIHCAVVGLDIGVDENGKLWLIEINNRDPSPMFAIEVKDKELFYTLKTNPVLYAKALEGFNARGKQCDF